MSMNASFILAEDRLDLTFQGDLDLTLSDSVCRLLANIPAGLLTCIIDLTRIERVFDSGIALLWMIGERLDRIGARMLVLSDHPLILQQLPRIMANVLMIIPLDIDNVTDHRKSRRV